MIPSSLYKRIGFPVGYKVLGLILREVFWLLVFESFLGRFDGVLRGFCFLWVFKWGLWVIVSKDTKTKGIRYQNPSF